MSAYGKYVIIAHVNNNQRRNSSVQKRLSCPKNIRQIKYSGFVTKHQSVCRNFGHAALVVIDRHNGFMKAMCT